MGEFTSHQRKIIDRYYAHRDEIMLTRLQELASELYLADSPAKQERLWKRVRTALAQLKVSPAMIDHIVEKRDPAVLAAHVQDLFKRPGPRSA